MYVAAATRSELIYNVFQKTFPISFLNNSVKTKFISIISGVQCPEEISYQKIINLPTSPE